MNGGLSFKHIKTFSFEIPLVFFKKYFLHFREQYLSNIYENGQKAVFTSPNSTPIPQKLLDYFVGLLDNSLQKCYAAIHLPTKKYNV